MTRRSSRMYVTPASGTLSDMSVHSATAALVPMESNKDLR